MVNFVPFPSSDFTEISPLYSSIIFLTMVKPSPIPEFLVVKLGSKICSNLSLGIPIPLSSITMMIFLLKSYASILMMDFLCSETACFALVIKLVKILER